MMQRLLIVTMLASGLAGCSKPTASAAPVQRTTQLPTATEVFNLRSKCQQLGEALDQNTAHGASWSRDLITNYDPKTNRCYVEMTDSNHTKKEYLRNLYDGQTKELLAYTKAQGDPCCRANLVGMTFVGGNNAADNCKAGGDCGYSRVGEFIDEKMKRDDAVTQ